VSGFVYVPKTARNFFASGRAHVLVYEDRVVAPDYFQFRCPWCRAIHRHGVRSGPVATACSEQSGSPLVDTGYVLHFGGTVAYGEFPRLGANDFILLSNKLRRVSVDVEKSAS
jgi:hypothetical protein